MLKNHKILKCFSGGENQEAIDRSKKTPLNLIEQNTAKMFDRVTEKRRKFVVNRV